MPGLVERFRNMGIGPETDWWMADRERLFAGMPSPIPMLIENASITRLDSIQCPTLGEAIAHVEQASRTWRFDLVGVGEDTTIHPPRPHAVSVSYTFRIILPQGALVKIEGWGRDMDELVGPVVDAAETCERAQRAG